VNVASPSLAHVRKSPQIDGAAKAVLVKVKPPGGGLLGGFCLELRQLRRIGVSGDWGYAGATVTLTTLSHFQLIYIKHLKNTSLRIEVGKSGRPMMPWPIPTYAIIAVALAGLALGVYLAYGLFAL
jgi:hypothetical protein